MGRIIRNTISYGFVTLILAALGFCIYLFLDDLDGPEVTMTPDTGRISPTQEITLKLADAKSGVRSVVVTIHRNNQSLVILDKVFSEPVPVQTTSFNLKNAGLRDGAFELEITARDNSLMSFGKGNGTTRKWNMQLDTQPPKVRIKTTVPALRRGSVTAIAYSVSEDASMTGVQLGEQFFPAFLQPNGLYYCFFPFPLDTPKGKFTPELLTRDLAGNESRNRLLKAGFTAELAARLVNVALALKSEEESGATLDLISVDLYTGTARLFKAGAAPGFLVHGGRARAVGDVSLPVGILGGVNGQSRVVHLCAGDYAVLVSDGLLVDGTAWVAKQLELSAAAGEAPAQVAKTLVETARARALRTGRPDDITAAVLRLESGG